MRCPWTPPFPSHLFLDPKRKPSTLLLAVAVGCGIGSCRLLLHVGADGDAGQNAQPLQDRPAMFRRVGRHGALQGVFDGQPYLGSLHFLHSQARLAAWPTVTQQVESEVGMVEPPPPMDLVIMNPPFTRDSLRHDQFTRKDEQVIKRREKEILEGQPYREAARLHSSGGAFTVLGEKMLKTNSGTLALILPSVVPTAPGNLEIRRYLARRFHIDTIVSSHDPSRIFFSENTSIGEILLICRRWNSEKGKPPTRVVNLVRNPATPLAALDATARIERADGAGGQDSYDFTVQQVDSERIARGDWFAVNFLSPFLVEAYRTLGERSPAAVPIVPMSKLAEVGPAGQRIRDAYTYQSMPTALGRRALWHHKTGITQSMLAETDVYIEPKPARRHLADSDWEQRSDMLLAHRLRLNLARVAAVMLPERAVGSIWTPCRPKTPVSPRRCACTSTPRLVSWHCSANATIACRRTRRSHLIPSDLCLCPTLPAWRKQGGTC